jgi:hypothetical protein
LTADGTGTNFFKDLRPVEGGIAMPGPLLVALALTFSSGLPLRPETAPPRFNLGLVDLVALAASMPPEVNPAARLKETAPPRTLSELHQRVEAFLAGDVKRAVEKARWQLAAARRNATVDPGTGSFEGNPWGALLAVVIGSISYTANPSLRDAKACAAFLEGLERRARALHEDVPESDESVTPDLLARFERLSAELSVNFPCRGRR